MNQDRHPDAYKITGRDSWWKFVKDPYHSRKKELVVYSYDLYDALQTGDKVFVCYFVFSSTKMDISWDKSCTRIARKRYTKPRTDGFIYDIRDKK